MISKEIIECFDDSLGFLKTTEGQKFLKKEVTMGQMAAKVGRSIGMKLRFSKLFVCTVDEDFDYISGDGKVEVYVKDKYLMEQTNGRGRLLFIFKEDHSEDVTEPKSMTDLEKQVLGYIHDIEDFEEDVEIMAGECRAIRRCFFNKYRIDEKLKKYDEFEKRLEKLEFSFCQNNLFKRK